MTKRPTIANLLVIIGLLLLTALRPNTPAAQDSLNGKGLLRFREECNRLSEETCRLLSERIMRSRNDKMFRRMQPHIEQGKAFVAVGAAHLPGEQGILNLLAKQGYQITRVF